MLGILSRYWTDNPVLTKELRTRMRGARAYWILTGYLLFLSFILFVQYAFWWSEARTGGGLSAGSKIGQRFFLTMIGVQAFLVLFITPAVTSGAITVEKEQRTMEMLEMTRLARGAIISGKLLAAVGFVALLLVSSLPLTSLCFVLGGVSPEQVTFWYLLLLVGSLVAGALGLMWSTIARTTTAAVLYTYLTIIVPPIVMLVFLVIGAVSSWRNGPGMVAELMIPLVLCLFGVMSPDMLGVGSQTAPFFQAWQMRHFYALTLPTWLPPVSTYVLLALVLAAVAVTRLETFPERRALLVRGLVALLFLQQCFFLFGARFSAHVFGGAGLLATLRSFPLISVLGYPVLLLLLCVPMFACGELRPTEARRFTSWLVHGWTPAGWRRARMASGLPFLFLLLAIILGSYALSFVAIGHGRAILTGEITPGPMPAGAAAPSGGFIPAALLSAVAVLALWSFGLCMSLVTRNRWVALVISYAAIVFVIVAPAVATGYYQSNPDAGAPSILINLHYLNPLFGLAEMSDVSGRFWSGLPLMFGTTPLWMVSSVCFLLISGVSLLVSLPFVTSIAARPALPYEDLAAQV